MKQEVMVFAKPEFSRIVAVLSRIKVMNSVTKDEEETRTTY